MSLQIWLPLNGNVDNQGLSDLTFSVASTNTTVNDSGKIGKCYENNSFTAGGILSDKEIYLGQNQSMFCWFKINSLRSNSSLGGGLVTQHRSTMNQGMGITIRYVTESTGYLSINTGNGDSRTYNAYYGNTLLQAGVWYHGGYTYDGTTIRLYVNGVLDGSFEYSNMKVEPDYIYIFRWSLHTASYSFDGCLNDVRIYDNVLSPREIKEISKALLLHFPLSCPGGENLMINTAKPDVSTPEKYPRLIGQTVNTYVTGGSDTDLTVSTHGFKAEAKNNGNRLVVRFGTTNVSAATMQGLSVGETYTLSFDAEWKLMSENTDDSKTYYLSCRLSDDKKSTGTIVTDVVYNYGEVTPENKGKKMSARVEWTFVVPDNVTMLCIYPAICTSAETSHYVAGNYIELRNLKLEKGDKATIWCPAPSEDVYSAMGYDDPIEYDVSGYRHNGIKVGTLTPCIDSPRYTGSLKFGSGKYIHTNQEFYDMLKYTQTNEITVSIWAKMDTWATREYNQMMVSCQQSGGFGLVVTVYGGFTFQIGTGESKNAYRGLNTNDLFTVSDIGDGWHLFTGTYDGLVAKLYIDGNFIKSGAEYTTVTPVFYYKGASAIIVGGEAKSSYTASDANYYFDGYLSDFRLYHTALTDNEVMELYHTPITLSNTATLLTQGELSEV